MEKVLTILIPVYNTEKYIKRCLDSVLLKETNDKVEVIVVSDGSKDKSINIAKEYAEKYPNTLKIIEKENGGHGSTLNKGLEIASGKYFRVLDSDDWFNSIDYIKYIKKLSKETADLVITNYSQEHVYNGKSDYKKYELLEENKMYKFDEFDLSLLKGEYFVMATSTYKTSLLKKSQLKLMEKTFYVDMQYNLIPIKEVETFTYYDLDIYRYFIGRADQSVNTASMVKNKNDHEKVLKYMIDFYESQKPELSEIKKEYIKVIINYTLFTHYNIFCRYAVNNKDSYNKIKSFDNYLKNNSPELYKVSDSMSFTRAHRKTNFIFVKHFGKLFNKSLVLLSKLNRRFK